MVVCGSLWWFVVFSATQEDFRKVKNVNKIILFFISAQNIDHGHVFPRKISFAQQLEIFNAI